MSEILIKTILEGSPTIYFLKGLPASGKSTWAKDKVNSSDGSTVRINKDSMRAMLGLEFSRKFETTVIEGCRATGVSALHNGFNIIVDDTNFAPKHFNFWEALAKQHSYGLQEVFFNTPLDTCLSRDHERPDKVGEQVIHDMYIKYFNELSVEPMYVTQDSNLPHAVIVDIDGTVAVMNGRGPFDISKVLTDVPNTPVAGLIKELHCFGKNIIFVSGRKDSCRSDTAHWLYRHLGFSDFTLLMRKSDDNRADNIVKQEIYDEHIRGKFFIEFVLDDRNSVVDMWRKTLGLPCFQVNYGDF